MKIWNEKSERPVYVRINHTNSPPVDWLTTYPVYLCDAEGNPYYKGLKGGGILVREDGRRTSYVSPELAYRAGITLDSENRWDEQECIATLLRFVKEGD